MKVLHLAAHEGSGAGRAAARLHTGLYEQGISSSMLVLQKSSNDPSVLQIDNPIKLIKRIQGKMMGGTLSQALGEGLTFSVNATPSLLTARVSSFQPDVINLHWVGWDYLRIEDIAKFRVPIVWTLQDMWPFTGGCHYNINCDRYFQACGSCPQLHSTRQSDLSRWVWERKLRAWEKLDLTIVAPSHWMGDCAKKSSLFHDRRVEVIPFCLDTEAYQPLDQTNARQQLNLPLDKQIVLFGALSPTKDERKGFQYLIPALQKLSQSGWSERVELVIFGAPEPAQPIALGFKTHYLGQLNDHRLVQVYSAADVMVVPSLQESFGQTASEALACGTPVVAFNTTGLKDIIDHYHNGYLASPFEIEDLAHGITWILQDIDRLSKLRRQARIKAEKFFNLSRQAISYVSLYKELLTHTRIS